MVSGETKGKLRFGLETLLIVLVLILSACAGGDTDNEETQTRSEANPTAQNTNEMGDMDMGTQAATEDAGQSSEGMDMGDSPQIPTGLAYAEGEEIYFIHTEVSDPEIAELLSNMMNSPVLVVPELAQAPEELLATVYVFTNGPEGMGPLGFQPDVFDNPPETDGYSPLRQIILVTWVDPAAARELRSAADVTAAQTAGEVTFETPGVVVNMPFVTWPGGSR